MGHQSDTFPPCLQKTLELKKLYIDFSFIGAVQGLVVQKPDKTNRGYVNADKCKSMRITHTRDKSITQYMLDKPLKNVKSFKDLGIAISKDLSWDNHISITVNKATNLLGLIKRSVGTTNVNAFFMLYLYLVRPILEYAVLVWCPGGGTWVFFGWVCAARDFKLAPRSKKNFPLN